MLKCTANSERKHRHSFTGVGVGTPNVYPALAGRFGTAPIRLLECRVTTCRLRHRNWRVYFVYSKKYMLLRGSFRRFVLHCNEPVAGVAVCIVIIPTVQ